MLKFLMIGFGLSIVSSIVSMFVWGLEKAYMLSGILGLIFIGVAILLSGSLLSGPEMLANLSTESKEERTKRNQVVLYAILLAVPCLSTAGGIYYFV